MLCILFLFLFHPPYQDFQWKKSVNRLIKNERPNLSSTYMPVIRIQMKVAS